MQHPIFFSNMSRFDADFIINAFSNEEIESKHHFRRLLKASTTNGKSFLIESPIKHIESNDDSTLVVYFDKSTTKFLFKCAESDNLPYFSIFEKVRTWVLQFGEKRFTILKDDFSEEARKIISDRLSRHENYSFSDYLYADPTKTFACEQTSTDETETQRGDRRGGGRGSSVRGGRRNIVLETENVESC